jgi:hypothetical protein
MVKTSTLRITVVRAPETDLVTGQLPGATDWNQARGAALRAVHALFDCLSYFQAFQVTVAFDEGEGPEVYPSD